jgi:thiol-disulfide isomerase/thioredoxin
MCPHQMQMTEPTPTRSLVRFPLLLAAMLGLCLAGAGVWFAGRPPEQAVAPECQASTVVAKRIAPLARGEVAAVAVARTPKPSLATTFQNAAGTPMTLADLKGRVTLVNLWATWCVPCRQEMPALDKLQAELGGQDFQVVAINVDTRNLDKPKAWLAENGIRNLAFYADPTGRLMQELQRSGQLVGLPTTVLLDTTGCEIAVLKGPAEWASADATALIRAALGRT